MKAIFAAVVAACSLLVAFPARGEPAPPAVWEDTASPNWIGAWGAGPEHNRFPAAADQSFRMIVHPSVPGEAVRIRLSNAFGVKPVTLSSFTVAVRTEGAAVDPSTLTRLAFAGQPSVTIPAGDEAVSDPVGIDFSFGDDLAVSFYAPADTGPMTGHGFTHVNPLVTSYQTAPGGGDVTGNTDGTAFPLTTGHRYFLMGLEAYTRGALGTVVAFGDSKTDGTGSNTDKYEDYPNQLALRVNGAGLPLGVVNEGIGGNSASECPVATAAFAEAGVRRFERDVLSWPNVRSVIIWLGGNDIRQCATTTVDDVAAALDAVIVRAKEAGLKVLLATYPPNVCWAFVATDCPGYVATKQRVWPLTCPGQLGDDQRIVLNEWIRAQAGRVDQLLEWNELLTCPMDDALSECPVGDPNNVHRQDPRFETRDGVHPGPAGYRAMAAMISLEALSPSQRSRGKSNRSR